MQASEIKELLKATPFEPIDICLSDGRSVTIRHPDQAAVSMRKLFVGVARINRSGKLATPRAADAIAKDWILIDLVHIVSAEPSNGQQRRSRREQR